MSGGQNQPCLNGAEVNALEHGEAIAAGFTEIYRLLLKHRGDLLANDGPLARFVQDEVRAFVRSGQTYDTLLRDSYHPDMLRDALDRDRFFDWLWAAVEHVPYLAKVIAAEREDLWKGDTPIFTTRPGSRDLRTSSNQRIVNFLNESSMTVVKRRLQQLSNEDLSQQLLLIQASLAKPVSTEQRNPSELQLAVVGRGRGGIRCPSASSGKKRSTTSASGSGAR
jgi:lantibiotic modifying enzyme